GRWLVDAASRRAVAARHFPRRTAATVRETAGTLPRSGRARRGRPPRRGPRPGRRLDRRAGRATPAPPRRRECRGRNTDRRNTGGGARRQRLRLVAPPVVLVGRGQGPVAARSAGRARPGWRPRRVGPRRLGRDQRNVGRGAGRLPARGATWVALRP